MFVLAVILSTEYSAHVFNYLFYTIYCKISGIFTVYKDMFFYFLTKYIGETDISSVSP